MTKKTWRKIIQELRLMFSMLKKMNMYPAYISKQLKS